MTMNRHEMQGIADATGKSFSPHYLAAKKSIDDRALNHYVRQTLGEALQQLSQNNREGIHILEVGAGIGTMFARMIDWQLLPGPATYLVTDNDPGQQQAARCYLTQWAQQRGHALSWPEQYRALLLTPRGEISLILATGSIEELSGTAHPRGPFHLLVAHAVLDLVDAAAMLPQLLAQMAHGGLAYLSCNFDGETVFLPPSEDDKQIIRGYHNSMETRQIGASHTGRSLLHLMQSPDFEILAAGSSDWIIHPRNRQYTQDESFFLHAIIDTVAAELARKPDPPVGLSAWADARHRQVEVGELSFLAKHLDLLAKRMNLVP